MKTIESGKDKIKKICEVLKKETLEPAQKEAEKIIEDAELEAEKIINQAKKAIEEMKISAHEEIEREKEVFRATLIQASKQAVAMLKQKIEEKLFHPELSHLLTKATQDPKVIADIITAILKALEKEGTQGDLSVYIAAAVPAQVVNELLGEQILSRLKERSVLLSSIGGGVEVKLKKENLTIDLSNETLKELVANYIRKDFHHLFFAN